MARSNGPMGVSVCGLMVMMMIMGAAAQAPAPAVDCQTVVLTLSDCLGYVTGTDKTPPAACCTELSSVVKSTPQCLCLLFNTTFTAPLGVNITLAQQLPSKCNVQTPPTSLCASYGIPVSSPTPSPVVAPSPAKTPSSTSAPASAPTTTSPSSTPMGAPSGSSPSPLASMVPTVSPGPASNVSTTTPSPNSAHAITSRNAGTAASLLLLGAILFS